MSLLVAGGIAGGENPHVAAERSIAPWNKMEGTRSPRGAGRFMPGKAIARDDRRDTVKPPAIEPIPVLPHVTLLPKASLGMLLACERNAFERRRAAWQAI